jgi:hypothetical protein
MSALVPDGAAPSTSLWHAARVNRSVACPSGPGQPAGLLYNHLSKTGGTTVQDVVFPAVCGRGNKLSARKHYSGDEPAFKGRDGCVLQRDIDYSMNVNARDASIFYVLGSIREPCDYYLSLWSFISDCHRKNPKASMFQNTPAWKYAWKSGVLGLSPPYNNSRDIGRFHEWHRSLHKAYERGDSYEQRVNAGKELYAERVARRYGSFDNVHCWMRTSTLLEDATTCVDRYTGDCQGNVRGKAWRWHLDHALESSRTGPPGKAEKASSHASCGGFFGAEEEAKLMAREESVLSARGFPSFADFGIRSCCAEASLGSTRFREMTLSLFSGGRAEC